MNGFIELKKRRTKDNLGAVQNRILDIIPDTISASILVLAEIFS
jgi:hypothetical protein